MPCKWSLSALIPRSPVSWALGCVSMLNKETKEELPVLVFQHGLLSCLVVSLLWILIRLGCQVLLEDYPDIWFGSCGPQGQVVWHRIEHGTAWSLDPLDTRFICSREYRLGCSLHTNLLQITEKENEWTEWCGVWRTAVSWTEVASRFTHDNNR